MNFDDGFIPGPPIAVCVTHRVFIPCRIDDDTCVFSRSTDDVWDVRQYQYGDPA